ncbi:Tannase/feruloyl esterase [Xylariomycetidae sp. FL2044]|nr:Tannase/feruloyl esterase [Xylariomycetidae sp. FL2044]
MSFQGRCTAIQPEIHIRNSSRTVLEFIPSGTNITFPDNDPTCNRNSQIISVDICRIALSIPTSNRSSITFEMWLPEAWTGRTLATGNGGIDGCIKYDDIAYGVANGFATVGTNNGHNGTYGDAFYQNEDVVIDFSWRSLHTSAIAAKGLSKIFYEEEPGRSYYIGCSLGGRQGIGAAEKFPEDFDGILAGAPAVDFNSLYAWRASFFPRTGSVGSENFISPQTWNTTIHNEVLRQCDDIDGVLDGIIEDPTLCQFRPETLLCEKAVGNGTCLSGVQVDIVKSIFSSYLWPNGTLLYPGMQPGNEILAAAGLYSGSPWAPSEGWFRFAILEDPSWDPSTYSLKDAVTAVEKDPGSIRTWPSTLRDFESRGGKLLTYHGQQDQQITSFNSIRLYEHLASGMGYTYEQMDQFYRFFRIPGMSHCNGGPGAWVFGQGGGVSGSVDFDSEINILASLVEWVEHGTPPETITGTKFVGDSTTEGVAYKHRHCRYPFRSTYRGSGLDPLDEGSWECRGA